LFTRTSSRGEWKQGLKKEVGARLLGLQEYWICENPFVLGTLRGLVVMVDAIALDVTLNISLIAYLNKI